MNQGTRNMALFDWRMQMFFVAAAHAINEIGKVIATATAARSGLHFFAQPALVGIILAHGQVTFGTVEDVSDDIVRTCIGPGLGLGWCGTRRRRQSGHSWAFCVSGACSRQACSRNAFAPENLGSD